jgi:pyridoxine 5'-phosphate synthase PdxJ
MPTGRYCDLHWQERRLVFHRYPRPEASELRTRIAAFGNWAEVARSFGLPVRMGQTLRYELERWERQKQQTEKEHEPDYGPWL